MNTRRGVSLIELLVVMSACTVLMTLTGALLHRIMQIQIQSRSQFGAERAALRLSQQFRGDVQRARTAVTDNSSKDERPFLRLVLMDGRSVEYSRLNEVVVRVESGDHRHVWREEFSFPGVEALKIEQTSAPQRLVLTVIRKPGEQAPAGDNTLKRADSPSMSLCAEATVGRDLRFGKMPAKQGANE
jgi:prepilin-type N-terminal cleavage/methylation domain-containing protein